MKSVGDRGTVIEVEEMKEHEKASYRDMTKVLKESESDDLTRQDSKSSSSSSAGPIIQADYMDDLMMSRWSMTQLIMTPYDCEVLYNCILSFLIYME